MTTADLILLSLLLTLALGKAICMVVMVDCWVKMKAHEYDHS